MAADDSLPTQDELEELEELLERGGYPPDTGENAVRSAAVDRETYDDFLEVAQQAAAQHWDRDTYYPYEDYRGELTLGGDPDGRPVGVTRRQLNEHMMVVGRNSAGKATFFYNVMDALNDRGIPFLAFDFKNDYRTVAADLDLAVINWRDLKFNPLQPPPGVELGRWAEALAETWAHAMGVMLPSKGYFFTRLRQLYRLYEDEIVAALREKADAHDVDIDLSQGLPGDDVGAVRAYWEQALDRLVTEHLPFDTVVDQIDTYLQHLATVVG